VFMCLMCGCGCGCGCVPVCAMQLWGCERVVVGVSECAGGYLCVVRVSRYAGVRWGGDVCV